ncbi:hypothetical protein CPC16_003339 [Podila verticillata]|nr:hypothetical protein CPC16_003339 [Podila verticillata]
MASRLHTGYVFQIAYSLYAPVINDKQSVRVFKDSSESGHENCEVVTINGQDAHTYIQYRADKNAGLSKDAGVRFNYALSGQEYSLEHHAWSDRIGGFSLCATLPADPSLDFQFNCGYNGMVNTRLNWAVVRGSLTGTFTSKSTFLDKICHDHPDETKPEAVAEALNIHTNPLVEVLNLFNYKREDRRRQHFERRMAGPTVITPVVESRPETKHIKKRSAFLGTGSASLNAVLLLLLQKK